MTKTHTVIRIINGRRCRCTDTGCPDFDQARENRFYIAHRLDTEGYEELEEAIRGLPLGARLPRKLKGKLPYFESESLRSLKRHGYHEIDEAAT